MTDTPVVISCDDLYRQLYPAAVAVLQSQKATQRDDGKWVLPSGYVATITNQIELVSGCNAALKIIY